jgi:hypothetical protein
MKVTQLIVNIALIALPTASYAHWSQNFYLPE